MSNHLSKFKSLTSLVLVQAILSQANTMSSDLALWKPKPRVDAWSKGLKNNFIGKGWSVAHDRRVARKKHNVKLHKKASRKHK